MTVAETAPLSVIGRLQTLLQAIHDVHPVSSLDELFKADERVSLLGARAIIGGHFEHRTDLLVADPELGTLGLVHAVDHATPKAAIRRLIEHAAFARHLVLGSQRQEDKTRLLPLTVELVLVLPPNESGLHERIGTTLVKIRRSASHLHGIGISLLPFGETPRPEHEEAADLRRAFCWLLTNTRKWFEEQAGASAADAPLRQWVRSVTLTDWRVPGERTLTFRIPEEPWNQQHATIHVVHGGNGAGKSSLVEALEFGLLGEVERLREQKVVLTDAVEHWSKGGRRAAAQAGMDERRPARVTLDLAVERQDAPLQRTVSSRTETPGSLLPRLRAGSFRLDQPAMDALVGASDERRAEYFLSCFFPSDDKAIRALAVARSDAERAWQQLPDDLAERLSDPAVERARLPPVTALVASLAWLSGPLFDCRVTDKGAALCLPVPLNDLRVLARIEPGLAEPVNTLARGSLSEADLDEALRALDRPMSALARNASMYAQWVNFARDALEHKAFKDWAPAQRKAASDPIEALNRWLHSLAFADLARRQREILEALLDARVRGWRLSGGGRPIGLAAIGGRQERQLSLIAELLHQEEEWNRNVAEFEQQEPTKTAAEERGATGLAPPTLTVAECEALDNVTEWLMWDEAVTDSADHMPQPRAPLGQTIAEALRMGERRTCGSLTIGTPGWAAEILSRLDRFASALFRLRERSAGRYGRISPPTERLGALRALHTTAQALSDAAEHAERIFLNQVLPTADKTGGAPPLLSRALDELLTLFTPARWGYQALGVNRGLGENGKQMLSFHHSDEENAQLRLNTAELNLLTVALFLLCAPRSDNPIRLLILDDPLQNMDEQTVTVLARGIGKLALLLPGGWQLVFFFHGEDDLSRFRNELPAWIYSLPWLMPVGTDVVSPTKVDGVEPPAPCATGHKRQRLADVLRRPR